MGKFDAKCVGSRWCDNAEKQWTKCFHCGEYSYCDDCRTCNNWKCIEYKK